MTDLTVVTSRVKRLQAFQPALDYYNIGGYIVSAI